MREIKFRAWNKEEEIMCYDNEDDSADYWDGICSSDIGIINHRLSIPDSQFSYRSKYEVMQFTGLHDKSGKDIFEGDIYLNQLGHKMELCFSLNEASFVGKSLRTGKEYPLINSKGHLLGEVIGNIYENPELVKED